MRARAMSRPSSGKTPRAPAPSRLAAVRVAALAGHKALGRLIAGTSVIPCALGPAGIVRSKREGDGATPAGVFRLSSALVRVDRIGRLRTLLPTRPLARTDGWCDDAGCVLYNRPVVLPCSARHEHLWRDDALYDCVVVIDYNTARIRRGRGSAIFLHVAALGLPPTAGCVALPRAALLRLLPRLGPMTRVTIG